MTLDTYPSVPLSCPWCGASFRLILTRAELDRSPPRAQHRCTNCHAGLGIDLQSAEAALRCGTPLHFHIIEVPGMPADLTRGSFRIDADRTLPVSIVDAGDDPDRLFSEIQIHLPTNPAIRAAVDALLGERGAWSAVQHQQPYVTAFDVLRGQGKGECMPATVGG